MNTLSFRKEGAIGFLTLNRPANYNAVNLEMMEELESFWAGLRDDKETRVIVLDGGESKGFCAGLDMNSFGPEIFSMKAEDAYNAQRRLSRLMLAMRKAPQPIICAIHGSAAGLGFSFAMASDLRILAKGSRFSAAYINIGLGGADMAASYFLPRLIGSGRANEFLLTGNWMSAEDAMTTGFASRLVEKEELLPTATELAQTMVSKDVLGLRMTKEALNINIDAAGLEACLEIEDRNQIFMVLAKKTG